MGDLHTLVREYLAALDARANVYLRMIPTARDISDLDSAVQHTERALRAAVATTVDTGWRDRAPTAAEVIAHHEAHGGVWCGAPSPHRATPPRGRR